MVDGKYRIVNLDETNKIFEHEIVNVFLPIHFIICFGCSKEPST